MKTETNPGFQRRKTNVMKKIEKAAQARASGVDALSTDLSRLLGERGLLNLAYGAVQTVDEEQLKEAARRSPGFRPQMMLSLLTYCYLSTVYGSRDIEWSVDRDRTIRYICARTFPDWQNIRRFRRQNASLVRQCLVHVLKQTWALKFDQGEADYVGYEWFESELLEQIQEAAEARLRLSMLMDGAESE
jgi:transposase